MRRKIHDDQKHAQFVTFSCYKRRTLLNPVRAGLVERAVDWTWSSARWYVQGKQVGVPISMPGGII
jgi:hypothetical protein